MINKFVVLITVAVLPILYGCNSKKEEVKVKEHEEWWEKCLETNVPVTTFSGWLGDKDAPSRSAMRNHVESKKYSTLLDVPCGLCIDYYGLQSDGSKIQYQGLDITQKLVDRAKLLNIPVKRGSIEQIPFDDSSFDVCYSRHILEHLDYYQKAIAELVRVGRKEALIVFFIKPSKQPDVIDLSPANGATLYHNCYNKADLEKYVMSLSKVKNVHWEEVNNMENILHIYLK